ncbi:hypothetical protein FPV67DRAFT_1542515 [Lyophyllum atratum]|nr:hypothetical protein FPV67DRAFT_1542515 [Lyophyllum atratum]
MAQERLPICGLDKSVVIDPMRFHLMLGVMSLDEEAGIDHAHNTMGTTEAPETNAFPPGTPIPPCLQCPPLRLSLDARNRPSHPAQSPPPPPSPSPSPCCVLLGSASTAPSPPGSTMATAPELVSKLDLKVTIKSRDIIHPVKLKPPKPPRPKKLPQTSTSKPNRP